eukprot:scaffold133488_cov39-Cyclotella_meneghiniana.AAC.9
MASLDEYTRGEQRMIIVDGLGLDALFGRDGIYYGITRAMIEARQWLDSNPSTPVKGVLELYSSEVGNTEILASANFLEQDSGVPLLNI